MRPLKGNVQGSPVWVLMGYSRALCCSCSSTALHQAPPPGLPFVAGSEKWIPELCTTTTSLKSAHCSLYVIGTNATNNDVQSK